MNSTLSYVFRSSRPNNCSSENHEQRSVKISLVTFFKICLLLLFYRWLNSISIIFSWGYSYSSRDAGRMPRARKHSLSLRISSFKKVSSRNLFKIFLGRISIAAVQLVVMSRNSANQKKYRSEQVSIIP